MRRRVCHRGLKFVFFFFSSRRRHTRCSRDWSSDVCSSDLMIRHTRCSRDWSSDVCSSDLLTPRSSIGALVGAVYASGQLDQLEDWVTGLAWTQVVRLMDLTWKRSEERRVGKECRSRWSPYH